MILEDVAMLNIKPDIFSYTSDYFDQYLEYAGKRSLCTTTRNGGKSFVSPAALTLVKVTRFIAYRTCMITTIKCLNVMLIFMSTFSAYNYSKGGRGVEEWRGREGGRGMKENWGKQEEVQHEE